MKSQKEDILSKTNNGLEIFKHFIPSFEGLRKNFLSPLREESTPSASIFLNSETGYYQYKDFGNGQSLSPFDFVMELTGCDFVEAIKIIDRELFLNSERDYPILNTSANTPPSKSSYSIKLKPEFSSEDLNYWSEYKVTPEVLSQYNVFAVESYTIVNGKEHTFKSTTEQPIFTYKINEDCYKLYKPFSEEKKYKFQWLGTKPENYVFGASQLPDKCENIIIAAGEKDALCFASIGAFPVSLNSETSTLTEETYKFLKERTENIHVCYDIDQTGLSASDKLCKQWNLKKMSLPNKVKEQGGKDFADMMKLGISLDTPNNAPPLSLIDRIELTVYDSEKIIDKPIPVIAIDNNIICTAANISCFVGSSKSGKTGLLSAFMGGAMAVQGFPIDTLGFDVIRNNEGKLLLHVDSEQAPWNHKKNIDGVLGRSGRNKQPEWLKSYNMRQFSIEERKDGVVQLLEKYNSQFNGVYSIILDGCADFVTDPNEAKECFAVVQYFESLAIKYNCPLITILHLNPGSDKSRGHLGSQLERKAESMISLAKDGDISTIEGKFLRNAGTIPQLQFRYDIDKGYHTSIGRKIKPDASIQKRQDLQELANDLLDNGLIKLSYKELTGAIQTALGLGERTAQGRIEEMKKCDMIKYTDSTRSQLQLVKMQ